MDELNDPKFRELKAVYDKKLVDFVRMHTKKIIQQMDADTNYNANITDVPKIQIFDNFLSGLEAKVQKSARKIGYFNGSAHRLINQYKINFYYCTLPNLGTNYRHKEYA